MKTVKRVNSLFSLPYMVWMALFIVMPLLLILYYSFTDDTGAFSLTNYVRFFAQDSVYLAILMRSLGMAFVCTVICFFAGYPAAYILAKGRFKNSSFILFLFILPMWMNFLLRTYAWLTILSPNGLLSLLTAYFGWEINILYTQKAVLLGMVYNYLPFMILPIHTSLNRNNQNLVEAARDLGADSKTVFWRVTFPLSMPGIISGVIMVFTPAVTTFVISNLLGGKKHMLIGNLIEQQFTEVHDWHFGSAVSVIVMFIILVLLTVSVFHGDDDEGGVLL